MARPSTAVPGATRETYVEPGTNVTVPAHDNKGRPIWRMPKPSRYVAHFKSAASRVLYMRERYRVGVGMTIGVYDEQQATDIMRKVAQQTMHRVPVYAGVPASVDRENRACRRRADRISGVKPKTRRKKGGLKL